MSNTNTDYIVCIPSYKRSNICNDKTLTMLKKNNILSEKIYVYVANKEEYDEYIKILDKTYYHKLIIGKKGLVKQKQFIMESWKNGKYIVFFDDDVSSVDLSLSPLFKKHNLDYFIKYAFKECVKEHSYMWGVYAVFNPFFRKPKKEISKDLTFIVGAFYGIINRPKLNSIKLNITTKENDQKDDVERTIKYYINDGIVLRFNKIGFITKYYGNEGGGMGKFENRIQTAKGSSERLKEKYPEYGNIKIRKNGMYEFSLNKNPHKKTNNDDDDNDNSVVLNNTKKKIGSKKRHNKTKKYKYII